MSFDNFQIEQVNFNYNFLSGILRDKKIDFDLFLVIIAAKARRTYFLYLIKNGAKNSYLVGCVLNTSIRNRK